MNFRTFIIQKLIHLNENIYFYPKLKKVYKEILNSNDIFILDVGSNRGQSIDFFLNINKNIRIQGFEPNKELFKYLVRKYKYNQNVEVHNKGISSKTGTLIFNENVLDETSTFEELNLNSKFLLKKAKILGVKPDQIFSRKYEVEVIALYDYIFKSKINNIDVIKIDVEGHEFECLKGLFNSNLDIKIKYIQLENHKDDMFINNGNALNIKSILLENNFIEFKRIKHGFGNFHEVIYRNIKFS